MQTSFNPEARRKPLANEVMVQVFTGSSAKWVYCETAEDAMRCVEINRNWGIPAGIVRNPLNAVPAVYLMPSNLIEA